MMRKMTTLYSLVLAVVLAACGGCQTVHWSKGDSESPSYFKRAAKKPKSEFGKPEKITCIWKDAVYETNGVPRTRGFGGRVYFFDAEDRPIKVDGDLVVYGYDDTVTKGGHTSPDRKYVFKREDLQSHFSQTDIGPSYSIWIPWDDVGGERMEVSLVTAFSNGDAKVVCKGTMDRVVLPGRKNETNPEKSVNNLGLLAKDLREQLPPDIDQQLNAQAKRISSTEIPIPENGVIFKRQVAEPTASPFVFNEMQRVAAETVPIPATSSGSSSNVSLANGQSQPEEPSTVTTIGHREERRKAFGQPGSFR